MLFSCQAGLLENLEKKVPILHIDCGAKWDDDIMLNIFRECMKQSKLENIDSIASKIIWQRTIVTPSPEEWNKYVNLFWI